MNGKNNLIRTICNFVFVVGLVMLSSFGYAKEDTTITKITPGVYNSSNNNGDRIVIIESPDKENFFEIFTEEGITFAGVLLRNKNRARVRLDVMAKENWKNGKLVDWTYLAKKPMEFKIKWKKKKDKEQIILKRMFWRRDIINNNKEAINYIDLSGTYVLDKTQRPSAGRLLASYFTLLNNKELEQYALMNSLRWKIERLSDEDAEFLGQFPFYIKTEVYDNTYELLATYFVASDLSEINLVEE